jgi:hypothetical protein
MRDMVMNMNSKLKIHFQNQKNKSSLSRRCQNGEICRITRGVYADTIWYENLNSIDRHRELIKICSVLYPDAVITGLSAAVIYGLDILYSDDNLIRVNVVVERIPYGSHSDIIHFYSDQSSKDVGTEIVDGIKVHSLINTLFFILRHESEAQSFSILNSALYAISIKAPYDYGNSINYVYPTKSVEAHKLRLKLMQLIDKYNGGNGIKQARHLLQISTDGAESVGESILLLYCHRFGFLPPIVNLTLTATDTQFIGRVDLLWNLCGRKIEKRIKTDIMHGYYCRILQGKVSVDDTLVVEFDGFIKYSNSDTLSKTTGRKAVIAEKKREDEIRRFGHGMRRITWDEFRAPKLLYEKIKSAGAPIEKYAHPNLTSVFL